MTASVRGKKRTCQGCNEAFYDLNKDPAVCPLCQHEHASDAFSTAPKAPEPVAKKPAKPQESTTVNVDDNPDDAEDVLGDDDDDMDDDNADIIPKPSSATNDEA